MNKKIIFSFLFSFFLIYGFLSEAVVSLKASWKVHNYFPKKSPEEYFNSGKNLFQQKNIKKALPCFSIIQQSFPESQLVPEALFYSAQCFFHLGHPDLAHRDLEKLLHITTDNSFLEETFSMKLLIADALASGKRKHLYGLENLPRIENGYEDALKIYDEIIEVFPDKGIAAEALYNKSRLLKKDRKDKESLEILEKLIKIFPSHVLSKKAFVDISKIYMSYNEEEPLNSSHITKSLLILRQFCSQFPYDDENYQKLIESNIDKMQENSAETLFSIGSFYKKKKKVEAQNLYYNMILQKYPKTKIAKKISSVH